MSRMRGYRWKRNERAKWDRSNEETETGRIGRKKLKCKRDESEERLTRTGRGNKEKREVTEWVTGERKKSASQNH